MKHRTLSIYNREYVMAAIERMMDKVEKRGDCWLFVGSNDGIGYGKLYFAGKTIKTHVLSYLFHKGDLPKGMCACHSCNTKNCVNPAHLYMGSHSDNNAHAWRDGLQPVGLHLTNEQAMSLFREGMDEDVTNVELGRKYGITRSMARLIRKGLAYQWIHG